MYPEDAYLFEHIKAIIKLDNEDSKIDFKRTLDIHTRQGKAELVKDVSAIANSEPVSDPTGYYIIGASHTRLVDISQLNLDDATLQQIVNSRCHKPVIFQYRQFTIKGKTIGVIIIPKSDERPHLVSENYFDSKQNKLLQKGTCYIRKGSSTDIATREDLDLMYEERIQKRVENDIELQKQRNWVRAPKILTERLVDIEVRKQVTLSIYESILKDIDSIYKSNEVDSKDQFYYKLRQHIEILKRAKESEKIF